MEFAETLRPGLVSELLVQCRSVKAKRVFLLLADDLGHWWAKMLDRSGIRLGSGCRVIDKGGTFQAKYKLIQGLEKLPAIQWKRRNLEILKGSAPEKFAANAKALERVFA